MGQLCLRSSASTTDIMGADGLCNSTEIMCCITEHGQVPPVKDAPALACLNKKCGGSFGSTDFPEGLFEKSKIMDDTFWINYCICSDAASTRWTRAFSRLSSSSCAAAATPTSSR